jgi:thiamine pyrophosphokinase
VSSRTARATQRNPVSKKQKNKNKKYFKITLVTTKEYLEKYSKKHYNLKKKKTFKFIRIKE